MSIVTIILAYCLIRWIPFAWTAANEPVNLALAPADRTEYLISDAGGAGLAEVSAALKRYGAREAIGLLSNCGNLQLMVEPAIKVMCPRLRPDGSNLPQLTELLNQNVGAGMFVVLEANPYVPASSPGRLRTVIDRPDSGPHLSIYDLTP